MDVIDPAPGAGSAVLFGTKRLGERDMERTIGVDAAWHHLGMALIDGA